VKKDINLSADIHKTNIVPFSPALLPSSKSPTVEFLLGGVKVVRWIVKDFIKRRKREGDYSPSPRPSPLKGEGD
jgi:hypothetical protein